VPSYKDIKPKTRSGERTIDRLLALREHLDKEIPTRTLNKTLLLATWNIREFDSPAYGARLPEAMQYIAEVIARFDIVAIQEVRQSLDALERVRDILGDNWRYVVTDVTEGTRGNKERTAFLYDTRKVTFSGLAGEMVIPPIREKDENGKTVYRPVTQLARTPFMAGFKVGWTKVILTSVHILYGDSKANDPERVREISELAKFLRQRTEDETAWSRNVVLLGDFNIFKPGDLTFTAITDEGFVIPEQIQSLPSNALKNKHYDQIAFQIREGRFGFTGNAGVFDFYGSVFRSEDEQEYVPYMGERYLTTGSGKPRSNPSSYYKSYYRTHQMSDHLPMWVEIQIDYSDEYLGRLQEED
jgi:endonuclease/exonuclease/phosphatase family metal-dependent hydrolase